MRTAVWMWLGLMATGSGITRAESPLAVLDSHTLSEVFAHYAGSLPDSGGSFHDVSAERSTEQRLG